MDFMDFMDYALSLKRGCNGVFSRKKYLSLVAVVYYVLRRVRIPYMPNTLYDRTFNHVLYYQKLKAYLSVSTYQEPAPHHPCPQLNFFLGRRAVLCSARHPHLNLMKPSAIHHPTLFTLALLTYTVDTLIPIILPSTQLCLELNTRRFHTSFYRTRAY